MGARPFVAGERAAFLVSLGLTLLFAVIGALAFGLPALLFSAAFVGGLAVWRLLFMGRPIDEVRLLPAYLTTVTLFVIHVGEEFTGHMELVLSRLAGAPVSQSLFLSIAAFAAAAAWVAGGALLAAGRPMGRFILSTFLFGMIGGELTHFAFPFLLDQRFHYVAGMATAPFLVVSAIHLLRQALRPVKAAKPLGKECAP